MNVRTYIVLRRGRYGAVRVARTTAKRPSLQSDEAMLRIELQLPPDLFTAPVVTVQVDPVDVAVAVEVDEIASEDAA